MHLFSQARVSWQSLSMMQVASWGKQLFTAHHLLVGFTGSNGQCSLMHSIIAAEGVPCPCIVMATAAASLATLVASPVGTQTSSIAIAAAVFAMAAF